MWTPSLLLIYTNAPFFSPRVTGVPPITIEEQWLVVATFDAIMQAMQGASPAT